MNPAKTDQQQFDEDVNRVGKLVLGILAGVGIVAALMLSTLALIKSSDRTGTMSATATKSLGHTPSQPTVASIAKVQIAHVTRGCHTLIVDGATPGSPSAAIRIVAGGVVQVQNNDVMPHRLLRVSGPAAQIRTANMNHMGARSTVTFPTAGTYTLTTKAGEDYAKGIQTIGPDNTLRMKVVVLAA
jgi:plastocyanin